MDKRDLNIIDYWNIFSRQKYTMLVVTLVATLVTGGLILLFEPPEGAVEISFEPQTGSEE